MFTPLYANKTEFDVAGVIIEPSYEECSLYLEHEATKTTILVCGHTIGKDCISSWLESANTCPLCREPLFMTPEMADMILFTQILQGAVEDAVPVRMQIALRGNVPGCEAVLRVILSPFYSQALGRLSEFVVQDSDEEDGQDGDQEDDDAIIEESDNKDDEILVI